MINEAQRIVDSQAQGVTAERTVCVCNVVREYFKIHAEYVQNTQ